ncbi:MAG TPA: polymer-forming cytoskeletal protein, partial [Gemmatimonadaceae bacterium]|nr:polymer-forming cytoskeletal protein [Gemmatimonadaceae bacterium]
MRALPMLVALAAVSLAAAPSVAQSTAAGGGTPAAPQQLDSRLRADIGRLGASLGLPHVPPADSFALGGRTIPAGATVNGDVAVANGPLEIDGRVNGDAIALRGDVVVRPGGVVTGDAVSVGGHVRLSGGTVNGEMRSLSDLAT